MTGSTGTQSVGRITETFADVQVPKSDVRVVAGVDDGTTAPAITELSRSWCEHDTLALESVYQTIILRAFLVVVLELCNRCFDIVCLNMFGLCTIMESLGEPTSTGSIGFTASIIRWGPDAWAKSSYLETSEAQCQWPLTESGTMSGCAWHEVATEDWPRNPQRRKAQEGASRRAGTRRHRCRK